MDYESRKYSCQATSGVGLTATISAVSKLVSCILMMSGVKAEISFGNITRINNTTLTQSVTNRGAGF